MLYFIEKRFNDEHRSTVKRKGKTVYIEKIALLPVNPIEDSGTKLRRDQDESPFLISPNQGSRFTLGNSAAGQPSASKTPQIEKVEQVEPSTFTDHKIFTKQKVLKIVSDYLEIAAFVAWFLELEPELEVLQGYFFKKYGKTSFNTRLLLDDSDFLSNLLRNILLFEETQVYDCLLQRLIPLQRLLERDFLELFESEYQLEYLLIYFEKLGRHFAKRRTMVSPSRSLIIAKQETDLEFKLNSIGIQREDLISLIEYYVNCTDSPKILMKIFESINLKTKEIVELFLEADQEYYLIRMSNDMDDLVSHLDAATLVANGRFDLFVLFDKSDLITIFNMRYNKRFTAYEQICKLIGDGENVEALCNVILQVHSTFWDLEKFPKFYKALIQVFSDIDPPEIKSNSSPRKVQEKTKDSWLVFIENPLLFCIKILYFFRKMKKQLDFKDTEISNLMDALQAFCISFCKNADEDVLMMNLFDKDSKDRDFLEYVFLVEDMTILEIEFIESIIYKMWDLGRHTMQTITQFMRLSFMSDEIQKFNMDVFKKKFEMPIEEGDSFQMEFRYTSNSVFMRVMSEIIWPVVIIMFEFIFSMQIIYYYKHFQFDQNWMINHYNNNKAFTIIHLYLRGSLIVSNVVKSILLKMFKREGFYHYYFYNILHALFFLQLIVYPVFYWDNFMMVNVLQALIVLTLIAYVYYNAMAVSNVGTILRIFARMVYVVIIFGLVSMILLTFIAFPLHSLFVDFSDSNGTFDMNMFRNLYNGVLTLFEFVFGAVIFIRPYHEQNIYTYTMTFLMVIFSFFGNIMMANMLIAFLSRQFDTITRKAKYYTREMQFGLVKIFNMRQLDSMFSMPYPLIGLALPFYFVMALSSTKRQKVNLFLRKIIHIVNIFVPTFIFMNAYLLVLLPVRYLQIFFRVLIKIFAKPVNILYLFAWMIGGVFLLLKLYVLDVATMCRIMLDFSTEGEDLLSTDLESRALENTIRTFKKLVRAALYHIEFFDKDRHGHEFQYAAKNHKEHKVKISDLMQLMGLSKQHKKIMNGVAMNITNEQLPEHSVHSEHSESEDDDEHNKDADDIGMSFSSKYSAVYSQPQEIMVKMMLKKFAMQISQGEEIDDLKVDINFMLKRVKHNVNLENVHRLIGFDKTTLYKASKLIRKTQEADVMTEVAVVRDRVNKLDTRIDEVVQDLHTIKELQVHLFDTLFQKISK